MSDAAADDDARPGKQAKLSKQQKATSAAKKPAGAADWRRVPPRMALIAAALDPNLPLQARRDKSACLSQPEIGDLCLS